MKHYLIITDSNEEYVYVGTGSFGAAEKDQRTGHHFPGGKQDSNDEDFKATLVREVGEEFGTEWGELVKVHKGSISQFNEGIADQADKAKYYILHLKDTSDPKTGELIESSFGKFSFPEDPSDPAFSKIIKLKIGEGEFAEEKGETERYPNDWHKTAFNALKKPAN
ncbi:NUDIX domain-containing protein [Vibrio nigripulchritudo]|uniref:NUDIX domain-containing protein n=1 Tax=Vibrio nigripulchritudo TaxID=28173 RepID=UPI0003B20DF4|nr:NUDIX domain-containing protein [Vibrio nigripulchritudo]CCN68576.1 hypothetical protein VIBNISFn118_1060001 [Vibrio nigripulchritudo SFn118]